MRAEPRLTDRGGRERLRLRVDLYSFPNFVRQPRPDRLCGPLVVERIPDSGLAGAGARSPWPLKYPPPLPPSPSMLGVIHVHQRTRRSVKEWVRSGAVLTLDQEIEGSNPSSPANSHNLWWSGDSPTTTSGGGAGCVVPDRVDERPAEIRRTRFERETVVCAPDSSRVVRLTLPALCA
jgi:hypothetical protein